MSKNKILILIAVFLALGGIVVLVVLAFVSGVFAGHQEAAESGSDLAVYQWTETASSHAGYRHSQMTCGTNIFVSDYEEACLRLTTTEPRPVIGRRGFGNGQVCAIPGQPVSTYIAADAGSEMPAFEPYRNICQPAFDWRTAKLREMAADRPGWRNQHITTTNAALLAEVARNLRDDPPVILAAFPFTGVTNFTTLNITIPALPGLLFCPYVYRVSNGTIYIAESLEFDNSSAQTKLTARWVPASPTLTRWLNSQ